MLNVFKPYGDVALLLLRLAIGAVFLYHGLGKWGAESTLMQVLSFVEPIAGIAILVGVVTELAALILAVVMLGAIYMKMTGFGQGAFDFAGTFAPQGGTGWEFDLMILVGCLVVLTMGAGRYAVDAMMRK